MLNSKPETASQDLENDSNCWMDQSVTLEEQGVSHQISFAKETSVCYSNPIARWKERPICAAVPSGWSLSAHSVLLLHVHFVLLVRQRGHGKEHPGHIGEEQAASVWRERGRATHEGMHRAAQDAVPQRAKGLPQHLSSAQQHHRVGLIITLRAHIFSLASLVIIYIQLFLDLLRIIII